MNNKAQFLLMSSLFFITVLIILIVTIERHVEGANAINYNSVVASEIIYQDYNYFHTLSNLLNADFTRNFNGNNVDVTLHSTIKSGFDPSNKLINYNNFLSLYKSKLGIGMNYSMSDLLNDVSNNHKYIRTLYPNNIQITNNYQSNTVTYTNNAEINYYSINLSFNGTIKNISWNIAPNGSQVPVSITGPKGYTANFVMNKVGNYTLRININTTSATNFVDLIFNYTSNINSINYSSITSISDVKLDFTVRVPSYGNVFKILSPYPNTRVNLGFGDYSISRGLE